MLTQRKGREKAEKNAQMLEELLPGATVKVMGASLGRSVLVSYKAVSVYVPRQLTDYVQWTLQAIRDAHLKINIEDYLRLGLPCTVGECIELRKRLTPPLREVHPVIHKEHQDDPEISEFCDTVTIKWKFVEGVKWTDYDGMRRRHPSFRYQLQWGDKAMSFVISYEPWEDERGRMTRWLQVVDMQGDEPAWDWQEVLDYDSLYSETCERLEAGEMLGEIVPDWLNIS